MERYKNIGGGSGVAGFEVSNDSIIVTFSSGSVYCWTDDSAGADNVAHMKMLAKQGQGLNSFIMRSVKTLFSWKK